MQVRLNIGNFFYQIEHVTTNHMIKRTGRITSRHRHPVFHLIYITEGRGIFRINDHTSKAEPGYLYVIGPNQWHEFIGDKEHPLSDLECTFYVNDDKNEPKVLTLYDIIEQQGDMDAPFSVGAPLFIPLHFRPLLIQCFHRILEKTTVYLSQAHTTIMISDLLVLIEAIIMYCTGSNKYTQISTDARVAMSIKQYLQMNMEKTVTLADLAELVHLTPTYICRCFKKQTGHSPMDYLQQIRMLEAEKLLLHTDLQINLISEKVGYQEPSYFARVFKAKHGASPKDFRKIIEYA
jgi:AraC-like DNA-binding protein/mannose-6-phosphate isomerase-like protein (cupin superfamily)